MPKNGSTKNCSNQGFVMQNRLREIRAGAPLLKPCACFQRYTLSGNMMNGAARKRPDELRNIEIVATLSRQLVPEYGLTEAEIAIVEGNDK